MVLGHRLHLWITHLSFHLFEIPSLQCDARILLIRGSSFFLFFIMRYFILGFISVMFRLLFLCFSLASRSFLLLRADLLSVRIDERVISTVCCKYKTEEVVDIFAI